MGDRARDRRPLRDRPPRSGVDPGKGRCCRPGATVSEPFVIRSSAGMAQISLDGNTLTISARGLEASRVVYEPEAGDTLRGVATLFDELARDWRGWDGERTWASLEGEATVTAVHDGLGTVELRVRLQKHES